MIVHTRFIIWSSVFNVPIVFCWQNIPLYYYEPHCIEIHTLKQIGFYWPHFSLQTTRRLPRIILLVNNKVKTHSNQKNWNPYLHSTDIVLNLCCCCRSSCCRSCCGFRSFVEGLMTKNQMIFRYKNQKALNLPANLRLALHFVHEQHRAWAGPGPLNCPLKKLPIWLAKTLSVQSDFGTKSVSYCSWVFLKCYL